jgi:hypothetical protein
MDVVSIILASIGYIIIGMLSLIIMVNKCNFYSAIQAPLIIILWPLFISIYLLSKI